ncbi:D-glycero-beta-D-manno-heptose 1-phosphate adenylyltransferase [Streptomyces purpurogeneiscleroticus]|uniref:D-glycero-beta-D-manno-heptose 1-phosphate adenylyltransferase n=1 Tax=Streptomyces purpurogeneiscleroticus TaxID=68259 RepID=UPI001CBC09AE|nr:D-glycero-beta-D-manno-heptose 1-phosphate adenylyltransferase [Streptomyces purpurogeneiscleroticus]MBZ4016447.1 D-glycero-beta-D-manno-heptose 1-phosphate adenylyltransferase [Streptomyces purpurogeneiscleroticus]
MSRNAPLLVVGDSLLDHDLSGRAERLAPDAPVPVLKGLRRTVRPGGAALAACLAAEDGREVTFVTALGDDETSRTLRRLLSDRVRLVELPLSGALSSKTRLMARDRPLLRLDEGDGRAGGATEEAEQAIAAADAVLVADYGRGTADAVRPALARAARHVPLVWDPHPNGQPPVPGVKLATPAATEARTFATALAEDARPITARARPGRDEPASDGARVQLAQAAADARTLLRSWKAASVAVTMGERGALLTHGEAPMLVPAPWSAQGDACGAGDCFAACAAGLLADEALPEDAVQGAVHAATQFVEDGGAHGFTTHFTAAAAPQGGGESATELAARVRAAGGTVVAAGGCFDLLHAGHVALLQAARRAGDCLIVCLNSDSSVRRRKGDERPIVPEADRVRVLQALGCVDAVTVFEEDTPEQVLQDLRPHIWVKGGDYALTRMPETEVLEGWGGQVMLLPYLDGRSSTKLAERAAGGGLAEPHGDPLPGATADRVV